MADRSVGNPVDAVARAWPAEGLTRVPYWVYSDRALYDAKSKGRNQAVLLAISH